MSDDISMTAEPFDISSCQAEGLYLYFGQHRIALTKEYIERTAQDYWQDHTKLPEQVKTATEFQRCDSCPLNETGGICDSIRPIFPLIEYLDEYKSFEKVTAVYSDGRGIQRVAHTTLQQAMRFVSLMSLIQFCQTGKTYAKFFAGIMPLASAEEIAARLYLNAYYICGGNRSKATVLLGEMKKTLRDAVKNQVQRLNLICKNDVLVNAFVNTHIIVEIASADFHKTLDKMLQ